MFTAAPSHARILRVAAVQLASTPGDRARNLWHALSFVARAADRGAKLVVLPELFAPGAFVDRRDLAEERDGPTEAWLSAVAREREIHVGGGFVLREGDDLFTGWALADPSGTVVARVKAPLLLADAAQPTPAEHTDNIATVLDLAALGRIGIVLMLPVMPPLMPPASTTQAAVGARVDGVPAVFANRVGPTMRFSGRSSIIDGDGVVRAQLGDDDEGVIVADVAANVADGAAHKSVALGAAANSSITQLS